MRKEELFADPVIAVYGDEAPNVANGQKIATREICRGLRAYVRLWVDTRAGLGTVVCTDKILEHYQVSEERAFADALEGSRRRGLDVVSLDDVLEEFTGEKTKGDFEMYMVRNGEMYGASVLADELALAKLYERFGGPYTVLPSSVHEILVIPGVEMDARALRDIIASVNNQCLAPRERLASCAYVFDGKLREKE